MSISRPARCRMPLQIMAAALLLLGGASRGVLHAAQPEWVAPGNYRVLVQVSAIALPEGRVADELPVQLRIDFMKELAAVAPESRPNVASVQVIQYAPATGAAIESDSYAYAKGKFDRPFRWYDGAIPYEFPEFAAVEEFDDLRSLIVAELVQSAT